MKLCVDLGYKKLELEVDANITILDLKYIIEKGVGLFHDCQILSVKYKQNSTNHIRYLFMHDYETLSDSGICDGAVIDVDFDRTKHKLLGKIRSLNYKKNEAIDPDHTFIIIAENGIVDIDNAVTIVMNGQVIPTHNTYRTFCDRILKRLKYELHCKPLIRLSRYCSSSNEKSKIGKLILNKDAFSIMEENYETYFIVKEDSIKLSVTSEDGYEIGSIDIDESFTHKKLVDRLSNLLAEKVTEVYIEINDILMPILSDDDISIIVSHGSNIVMMLSYD